jgi:anti-sigma B factor antagonist
MDHLSLSERQADACVLVEAIGTVNSYTYTEFQQKVHGLIRMDHLVLDMSRVSHLSSAGLGVLMSAAELGQETGKKLYIMNPSEIVRLAIDSTGFPDLFPYVRSVSEVR